MNQQPTSTFATASPSRRETLGVRVRLFAVQASLVCLFFTGCQSLGLNNAASQSEKDRRLANADGILGPMARAVQTSLYGDVQANAATPEVTKQLDEANRLYAAGKFGAAARIFKQVANSQKNTAFGEEALFMLGEAYYKLGQYAQAQTAYEQLIADYPSTRRVEDVTHRLFRVASTWLDVPVPATTVSEIQQAGYEEGQGGSEPQKLNSDDITVKVPLLPNFHDKSRPIFDTSGRALRALKTIWLNDPTGPLADDAIMMTATHFLKKRNHVEADRYYKILREEYPKSPHLEKAFVLGSHVKLLSYQGPRYEGNTLAEARELKEATLRLFPDNSQRQQIRAELQDIYDAEAERQWIRVQHWQGKKKPKAVALACKQLISEFPESKWAEMARKTLSQIDPKRLQGLPGF